MVKLTEKEVKDRIKRDLNKCKSVFNGQKVKIYRGFRLTDGVYDLIVFKNGSSAVMKNNGHITYIEFGEYLISVPSPNVKDSDKLDFNNSTIYNISNGNIESEENKEIGVQLKSDIVIVDARILVVCVEKSIPKFYIMIDGYLEEIKPSIAEHLLNIADFSKEHIASLIKHYPEEEWCVQNGLVFNPNFGYVPSQIQLLAWKKARHVHITLKKGILPDKLLSVFSRGTRSAIRYVTMANV